MSARLAIRRLEIRGLAPRDHPDPDELKRRLLDASQKHLPEALAEAARALSGDVVLRMRRLEVDVTLDAAFEPRLFADVLAKAIARELQRAGERGSSDDVVVYASRAIYLAALLEALADGCAAERWWLRDAEGLRFLTAAQAIRTAALADRRTGLEALASLPPIRRMSVLRVLTPIEAERVLAGFSAQGGAASLEACADAVAQAASALPESASALALYVECFARKAALAGERLALAARLWTEIEEARRKDVGAATTAALPFDEEEAAARRTPDEAAARRILASAASRRSPASQSAPIYRFTQFGGLLLLLPDLGASAIAAATSEWPEAPPEAATLVAYAALGLCAGRDRFAEYLGDGLWRELFGLDPRASLAAILDRLSAFDDAMSSAFVDVGAPLERIQDARFLLARRDLVASRGARRALAGLARVAIRRFAQRLPGFRDASAPFLWGNVLAVSAAVERRPNGWSARLSRAPLDVLLSLARAAEGSVQSPSGLRIDISRTPA
jgi:hypothetical protein